MLTKGYSQIPMGYPVKHAVTRKLQKVKWSTTDLCDEDPYTLSISAFNQMTTAEISLVTTLMNNVGRDTVLNQAFHNRPPIGINIHKNYTITAVHQAFSILS